VNVRVVVKSPYPVLIAHTAHRVTIRAGELEIRESFPAQFRNSVSTYDIEAVDSVSIEDERR